MRKILAVLFGTIVSYNCLSQTFHTKSLSANIKTVQSYILDNPLSLPIIDLNGSEQILISFDELSYETKNFYYSIIHCNADWTKSDLAEIEYLDGFSNGVINEAYQSLNTTVLYTNYRLKIPNDELRFKCSGNYAVVIYEDGNRDEVKAIACFSVVEPLLSIDAHVKGNTDIEINKRYQQLDFSIEHTGVRIQDPFSDLKVVVKQNNRDDNKVSNIKPTYTSTFKQTYCNNPALIFEGGNEYRSIDFSSEYTYGNGIERIVFDHTYQHVILSNDKQRNDVTYLFNEDVNGKYIVHRQFSDEVDYEADYMWVHFSLCVEKPFFAGSIFISGDFVGNELKAQTRMDYNAENNCYEKALLVKQGGINYQYLYVPKNDSIGKLEPIEGSFWQTKNEYQIFIYYRPRGERYDRLIGWKNVQ